jgi:GH35 family endo-1,4-beta-xylanase
VIQQNPDPETLRALLDRRLQQLSETVLPELHDADVFNELVQWARFKNPLLGLFGAETKVEFVKEYLESTRRLNPELRLVINDYEQEPAYFEFLRRLLDAGAPVDIIGQQSHMHAGHWPLPRAWEILNRLSQLRRPILFTELSVLSGPPRKLDWRNRLEGWETDPENELKQADYLESFYRLLYSHTNCLGIVVWNYSDRRAWLGAPVGLLRKDGTPKPSYARLDSLVNERWRTRGQFVTGRNGIVTIPHAFEGEYLVTCEDVTVKGRHSVQKPLALHLDLPKQTTSRTTQ